MEKIQVKLYCNKCAYPMEFEEEVNQFLKENEGKIIVRDIKYTTTPPHPDRNTWQIWTAMVIYEEKA